VVDGVDGLKTGFIKESGYGIVASAKQDNRRLIVVVNGLEKPEERRDDARKLLEWGFRNFAEAKLFDRGDPRLRAHIVYQWPLKPPLKKGDQVAVLRVTTPSDSVNEVPLYAAEDVPQAGAVRRGLDSILCLATRWLP
jgi:D-alanyl-D-alanine carboxypeptidase (penicillin-binding protein 5/6)